MPDAMEVEVGLLDGKGVDGKKLRQGEFVEVGLGEVAVVVGLLGGGEWAGVGCAAGGSVFAAAGGGTGEEDKASGFGEVDHALETFSPVRVVLEAFTGCADIIAERGRGVVGGVEILAAADEVHIGAGAQVEAPVVAVVKKRTDGAVDVEAPDFEDGDAGEIVREYHFKRSDKVVLGLVGHGVICG